MRGLAALPLFFILFFSAPMMVDAQNRINVNDPPCPDISQWTLISGSNISVNVSDSINYYLGFDMTFQNPDNPTEFVRQIRVLLPFVVVKNKQLQDKNYADAAVTYVTDGTEKATLKQYLTKSDVVLYVRWHTETDLKRGTEKLVGENEVWFWDTTGQWFYGHDLRIDRLMTSENFPGFNNYPITVGLKLSLSRKVYNSVEVPYAFVLIALKTAKGDK